MIRALICLRNKEDPICHILYLNIDKICNIFIIKMIAVPLLPIGLRGGI